MANSNSHVENVVHNDDPYADIVAAVKKQLEKNNETMIKTLEEKTETRIQDAVKRALEVQETEEATRKKAKKEPDFKSKGNKLRYEVNEEIKESNEKALKAIERKDYEPAKAALEAGMKIVDKQQKLIRIADREEAGWEVVRHYLSDDLASNSEDEKAINRARKEALVTIKKRKTKKKDSFRNAPPNQYKESDNRYKKWGSTSTQDRGRATKRLCCYRCSKEGHLQYNCPLKFGK